MTRRSVYLWGGPKHITAQRARAERLGAVASLSQLSQVTAHSESYRNCVFPLASLGLYITRTASASLSHSLCATVAGDGEDFAAEAESSTIAIGNARTISGESRIAHASYMPIHSRGVVHAQRFESDYTRVLGICTYGGLTMA